MSLKALPEWEDTLNDLQAKVEETVTADFENSFTLPKLKGEQCLPYSIGVGVISSSSSLEQSEHDVMAGPELPLRADVPNVLELRKRVADLTDALGSLCFESEKEAFLPSKQLEIELNDTKQKRKDLAGYFQERVLEYYRDSVDSYKEIEVMIASRWQAAVDGGEDVLRFDSQLREIVSTVRKEMNAAMSRVQVLSLASRSKETCSLADTDMSRYVEHVIAEHRATKPFQRFSAHARHLHISSYPQIIHNRRKVLRYLRSDSTGLLDSVSLEPSAVHETVVSLAKLFSDADWYASEIGKSFQALHRSPLVENGAEHDLNHIGPFYDGSLPCSFYWNPSDAAKPTTAREQATYLAHLQEWFAFVYQWQSAVMSKAKEAPETSISYSQEKKQTHLGKKKGANGATSNSAVANSKQRKAKKIKADIVPLESFQFKPDPCIPPPVERVPLLYGDVESVMIDDSYLDDCTVQPLCDLNTMQQHLAFPSIAPPLPSIVAAQHIIMTEDLTATESHLHSLFRDLKHSTSQSLEHSAMRRISVPNLDPMTSLLKTNDGTAPGGSAQGEDAQKNGTVAPEKREENTRRARKTHREDDDNEEDIRRGAYLVSSASSQLPQLDSEENRLHLQTLLLLCVVRTRQLRLKLQSALNYFRSVHYALSMQLDLKTVAKETRSTNSSCTASSEGNSFPFDSFVRERDGRIRVIRDGLSIFSKTAARDMELIDEQVLLLASLIDSKQKRVPQENVVIDKAFALVTLWKLYEREWSVMRPKVDVFDSFLEAYQSSICSSDRAALRQRCVDLISERPIFDVEKKSPSNIRQGYKAYQKYYEELASLLHSISAHQRRCELGGSFQRNPVLDRLMYPRVDSVRTPMVRLSATGDLRCLFHFVPTLNVLNDVHRIINDVTSTCTRIFSRSFMLAGAAHCEFPDYVHTGVQHDMSMRIAVIQLMRREWEATGMSSISSSGGGLSLSNSSSATVSPHTSTISFLERSFDQLDLVKELCNDSSIDKHSHLPVGGQQHHPQQGKQQQLPPHLQVDAEDSVTNTSNVIVSIWVRYANLLDSAGKVLRLLEESNLLLHVYETQSHIASANYGSIRTILDKSTGNSFAKVGLPNLHGETNVLALLDLDHTVEGGVGGCFLNLTSTLTDPNDDMEILGKLQLSQFAHTLLLSIVTNYHQLLITVPTSFDKKKSKRFTIREEPASEWTGERGCLSEDHFVNVAAIKLSALRESNDVLEPVMSIYNGAMERVTRCVALLSCFENVDQIYSHCIPSDRDLFPFETKYKGDVQMVMPYVLQPHANLEDNDFDSLKAGDEQGRGSSWGMFADMNPEEEQRSVIKGLVKSLFHTFHPKLMLEVARKRPTQLKLDVLVIETRCRRALYDVFRMLQSLGRMAFGHKVAEDGTEEWKVFVFEQMNLLQKELVAESKTMLDVEHILLCKIEIYDMMVEAVFLYKKENMIARAQASQFHVFRSLLAKVRAGAAHGCSFTRKVTQLGEASLDNPFWHLPLVCAYNNAHCPSSSGMVHIRQEVLDIMELVKTLPGTERVINGEAVSLEKLLSTRYIRPASEEPCCYRARKSMKLALRLSHEIESFFWLQENGTNESTLAQCCSAVDRMELWFSKSERRQRLQEFDGTIVRAANSSRASQNVNTSSRAWMLRGEESNEYEMDGLQTSPAILEEKVAMFGRISTIRVLDDIRVKLRRTRPPSGGTSTSQDDLRFVLFSLCIDHYAIKDVRHAVHQMLSRLLVRQELDNAERLLEEREMERKRRSDDITRTRQHTKLRSLVSKVAFDVAGAVRELTPTASSFYAIPEGKFTVGMTTMIAELLRVLHEDPRTHVQTAENIHHSIQRKVARLAEHCSQLTQKKEELARKAPLLTSRATIGKQGALHLQAKANESLAEANAVSKVRMKLVSQQHVYLLNQFEHPLQSQFVKVENTQSAVDVQQQTLYDNVVNHILRIEEDVVRNLVNHGQAPSSLKRKALRGLRLQSEELEDAKSQRSLEQQILKIESLIRIRDLIKDTVSERDMRERSSIAARDDLDKATAATLRVSLDELQRELERLQCSWVETEEKTKTFEEELIMQRGAASRLRQSLKQKSEQLSAMKIKNENLSTARVDLTGAEASSPRELEAGERRPRSPYTQQTQYGGNGVKSRTRPELRPGSASYSGTDLSRTSYFDVVRNSSTRSPKALNHHERSPSFGMEMSSAVHSALKKKVEGEAEVLARAKSMLRSDVDLREFAEGEEVVEQSLQALIDRKLRLQTELEGVRQALSSIATPLVPSSGAAGPEQGRKHVVRPSPPAPKSRRSETAPARKWFHRTVLRSATSSKRTRSSHAVQKHSRTTATAATVPSSSPRHQTTSLEVVLPLNNNVPNMKDRHNFTPRFKTPRRGKAPSSRPQSQQQSSGSHFTPTF